MFDPFKFPGLRYVEHISIEGINNGEPLPLFEPVPPKDRPGINTLEGWMRSCVESNTKAFVSTFGRQPANYEEVQHWVDSITRRDKEEYCATA